MPFFLVLIGAVLIIFNVRFIKEDDTSGKKVVKKNKNSFTRVLKDEELDLTAVDIIIGELRIEFSETLLELQKEIVELTGKVDSLIEEKVPEREGFVLPIEENEAILGNLNIEKEPYSKINEIGELLRSGFSVEEISEKFQMGRGEILLIKKLYLK